MLNVEINPLTAKYAKIKELSTQRNKIETQHFFAFLVLMNHLFLRCAGYINSFKIAKFASNYYQ
jgi:hypothetical protein